MKIELDQKDIFYIQAILLSGGANILQTENALRLKEINTEVQHKYEISQEQLGVAKTVIKKTIQPIGLRGVNIDTEILKQLEINIDSE